MPFASWIKRLPWVAVRKTKPVRKRQGAATGSERFVPRVEQLEARLTPSFVVTDTNDPANWNTTSLGGDPNCLRSQLYEASLASGTQTISFSLPKGSTITLNDSNGYLQYLDSNTLDGGTLGNVFIHGGTSHGCFYLNSGSPTIKNLTIEDGDAKGSTAGGIGFAGVGTLTLTNDTFLGNQSPGQFGGALYMSSGTTVDVTSCTFGNSSGGGNSAKSGGAIYQSGGTLNVTSSTFSSNTATHEGGAIYVNAGTVSLSGDAFSGNTATNKGGAIFVNNGTVNISSGCTFSTNKATTSGSSGGVLYVNSGTVTASDATFSSNQADRGGAIYNYRSGIVTLTNDTFSGNSGTTTTQYGGAILNEGTLTLTGDTFTLNQGGNHGGALANVFGATAIATVTNCTFYDNHATVGGAIYNGSTGTLYLDSDTINANTATTGGGLYIHTATTGHTTVTTCFNTIFDGNTANTTTKGPDVYSDNVSNTFTSSGGNLYGNTSGVTWKTTSTVGALYPDVHDAADKPMLSNLTTNGGYTQTMAPQSGSPALGAGNPVGTTTFPTLATDQRGFLRVVNNKIDIGAYENQSQFFTLTPPSSNTVGATTWNLGSFSDLLAATPWSVSVSWGDGTTSTFSQASQGTIGTASERTHYYASATSYTITVTITDNDGNISSMSFGVTGGPLVVNTLNDTAWDSSLYPTLPFDSKGNISLRSALQYVNNYNAPATIDFSSSLGTGTIALGSAPSLINLNLSITDSNSVTIDGTGASISVSGANITTATKGGVFYINTHSAVTVNDLSIIDGASSAEGGGVCNSNGNLTLSNDTIESNTAGTGGGIFSNNGTTTFRNDTIAYNHVTGGGNGGGVYRLDGSATFTDCSVVHNTATGSGGGIFDEANGNTLTVSDTTIADNGATNLGGGVYFAATGSEKATFVNDTLSGNTATKGAGIFNTFGALTLDNTTLTDNQATSTGGGVYVSGKDISPGSTTASLTAFDNILDGNTATAKPTSGDVYFAGKTFTSSGGNLYGNTNVPGGGGANQWAASDYHDATGNPGLGSLQNNGGDTQTLAILPGGVASQHNGVVTGVTSTTDQRGFGRTSNGTINIGAFQNQSQWYTQTGPGAQTSTAGTSTSFNLGSFSYSGSAGNLWTVDVAWGDNTADTVLTTSSQGTLPQQSHTYTVPGNFTVTITVKDPYNDFSQTNTATVTVSPGPVSQLVVTPSTATPTAGTPFTVTVKAEDANGNLVTSSSDSITLTSTDALQPLGGASYTHILVNGQWTFTVSQDTAGAQTLTATDTTSTLFQTALVNVQAGSPVNLSRSSGNNQTATVGSSLDPLVVEVTDANGNPVPGFTINWSGTGISPTTSTTNAAGLAQLNVTFGTAAGPYTYTASGTGLTSQQFTETATAGAATHLVMTTPPPSSVTAGSLFTVGVTAEDANDNIVTNFSGSAVVSLALNQGDTLGGTTQVTFSGGVATFSTLTLDKVGSHQLAFSATGGLTQNTADFNVNAGTATQYVISQPTPSIVAAGSNFTVLVLAEDSFGNIVTTFGNTNSIQLGIQTNPAGGTLTGGGSTTFTSGLATFSNLKINNAGAGYTLITANGSPSPLFNSMTSPFTVVAGAPSSVTIFSGNNQSGPAGGTLNPLVVEVTDSSGNPVAGATVNWAVVSGGGNLGGTPPVSSTTNSAGLASISATLGTTAGANSFSATVGSLPAVTFTETAGAGAAANLVAVVGNNQSGIVGTNLNHYLVVEATDANGAPVPGVTITWSAATGGGSTTPVSAVTGRNGEASFLATLGNSPGTQTFSFSTVGVLPVTFTENATVWQGTSLGGYVTQVASALDKNGHLELFGIGGDHALWYNVQTSGSTFTGWTPLGGYVKQITVATQAGGLLAVFAIGGDNAAYLITQNVGGSWTAGAYTDLGGYVQQLAAGLDLNGSLELFGIGGDNALWFNVQTSGTSFGGWNSLGGYVKQITVGTNFDGTLQVFGVGGDNAAWFRKQHSTGNLTFDSWTSLGGYVTQLATGLDLNHHLELFGIGGDHAIWVNSQTDNTGVNFSGWSSLGGYVTQIAVTTDQGDLDVFGIGGDSAIWYRKQNTANYLVFDPYVRVAASIAQLSAVTDTNGNAALFAIGKAFSDGQFFDQV